MEWRQAVGSLRLQGSRREFIEAARRARLKDMKLSPQDESRLYAFRELRVVGSNYSNPFVQAWKEQRSIPVDKAQDRLQWLYDVLKWQAADEALICPLIHENDAKVSCMWTGPL